MQQNRKLPEFDQVRHVHIIGVCGTLMGAFAAFLKRKGMDVTGSDQNVYPPMSDVLRSAGVKLLNGYSAENLKGLSSRPDLVVIGNVIRSDNPEAREAIDQGYAYTSLPEAMEKLLLKKTRNIVAAGTHGKTTTSSLMAHVLFKCGKNPSYFIGGVPEDLPFSFQVSSIDTGACFVLEGDEYDTAFWDKVPKFNHYLPDDAILTSIEYDHADIYPDIEAVTRAFEGLLSRIRPGGRLIACTDYPIIERILPQSNATVLTYGMDVKKARFTPASIRFTGGEAHFEVHDGGKKVDEVVLTIPGNHNILNALSVWIESRELGLDMATVRSALKSFRGVKRRQEVRGEVGGVMVIDDFAHHPTAVRETLRALKAKYSGRRLIAVFEPRSATSRRKVFQQEYVLAFDEADGIFIASPFDQSRIPAQDQFSSEQLVSDLKGRGKVAATFAEVEQGVSTVTQASKPGDLIAVLSNGGFGGFIPKLIQALGQPKDK